MISGIDGKSLNSPLSIPPPNSNTKTSSIAQKILQSDGTTNHFLTEGTIKRAGWTFLALAASAASPLIFYIFSATLGNTLTVILPIPILIAIRCAFNAYTTPNYENTAEVSRYREECKLIPLEEAFKKHGNRVSERKLLTNEQISQKYTAETKNIDTIPDLLAYHQKIQNLTGIEKFTLPSAKETNQKRFQRSCATLTLDEAIDLYTLEYIFTWNLLSPEEFKEKYLQKESSLHGLPALMDFYQNVENSRKQFDKENLYSLPDCISLKKKIQDDSADMSLKEIENLHSLEFLFSWNLLTVEQFVKKYEVHVETLFNTEGIHSVIAYYQKIQKIRNTASIRGISYPIPPPEHFSNRWLEKDYSLEHIICQQNIKQLIEYRIIQTPFFIDSLVRLENEFQKNQTKYTKSKEHIEKEEYLASIYPDPSKKEPKNIEQIKKQKEISLDILKNEYLENKIRLEQEYSRLKLSLKK